MIYIAHPYQGKRLNKRKVEKIVKSLIKMSVCSTYVSPIHAFGYLYKEVDYAWGMKMCLDLLKQCKSAIFCDGWENSNGCREEMEFCKERGIPFLFYKDVKGIL